MNKILLLLKKGWAITEMRQSQDFYYVGASHETGEANVEASGESLTEAINSLYFRAVTATPEWYLKQLQQVQS